MQILNSRCDPEEFFFDLAIAPESVLILDYDGTLAPFRTEPQRAVAYPGIYTIIDSMMERGNTRVVIVSGRAVASLLPLLPFTRRPEIWGCHGWERLMPDGRDIIPHVDSETRAALESATQLVADVLPFAARCEIKPASVAVHWRGLPEQLANWARDAVGEEWRTLAQREGLRLRDFDGGIELSAAGRDKSDAVDTVLAEAGDAAVLAYLGDDVTDEDAFAAVSGRGLAVLVAQQARSSAADVYLHPPEEVIDFLVRWTRTRGVSQEN